MGCLAVFGTESFILPAMGLILAAITLLRKPIEKAGDFMTEMPLCEQVLTIAVCVLATMATRMVPFFFSGLGKICPLISNTLGRRCPRGICPSCGVFAEGHSFLFGKSWCAGGAVSLR